MLALSRLDAGFCTACYHSGLPSLCYHKALTASAALCVFDLRAGMHMVTLFMSDTCF
jgi:hypothetical protein